MKRLYTYFALSATILLFSCSSSTGYAQSYIPGYSDATYQQFYDGLSPYGNWVDYKDYGYVWIPNEQGFRPYYNNGHWVYTDYGWTWVSNYSWGWAPFHYGRWIYDEAYGWMWVPGYEWAPAWVSWRSGGGCYGWAPLGPGLNFDMGIGSQIPYNYWAFVPNRYINNPRINNYYITPEKNVTIINNTRVINNTRITNNKTVYVIGPSATEVEKVTNEKITPAKIVQQNTPGDTKVSGTTVSIYKPAIRETSKQNEQIKPSRITNLSELKIHRENTGAAQNEIPRKEVKETPLTPVDGKPGPTLNSQKINNNPPVNEKTDPVTGKPNPVIQKQDPAIEKEVQAQQPQKVIPDQPAPDVKPKNTRETDNDPQTQNTQPNNPVINKQPTVTNDQHPVNDQPVKVTQVNPNNSPGTVHQDILPTPVNRQPVKTQPVNTPPPQRTKVYKQVNRSPSPVNHAPVMRNQNPGETRGSGRQFTPKERK